MARYCYDQLPARLADSVGAAMEIELQNRIPAGYDMNMNQAMNITQQMFQCVLARPVITPVGQHAGLVHLWWSMPIQNNRIVQVYIDNELFDVATETDTPEMWIPIDRSRSHTIELLAMDADNTEMIWTECTDQLQSWQPPFSDQVELALLPDSQLPPQTQIQVTVDNQYVEQQPLWPADSHRTGFGNLFGYGAFGFDDTTGPGLGLCQLGYGPLYCGNDAWRFKSTTLEPGVHTITMQAMTPDGTQLSDPVCRNNINTDTTPPPATNVYIDNEFTLHW